MFGICLACLMVDPAVKVAQEHILYPYITLLLLQYIPLNK